MHWTEPATADDSHSELEKNLWDAANQLRAGADLKPSEYSPTVLSLPEGANVGQAVNEATRAIEKENPDLADVLPKS